MFNSSAAIRSLIIYAACMAVAVVLGCLIANIEDLMSFYLAILLVAVMVLPMLLRWHHFWLICVWNTTAVLFFVPGRPTLLLAMVFVSLAISIVQHALNRKMEFAYAPSIALPLLLILAVMLITARLTGGIGLNILGSSEVGGRRYIFMLGGIVGYFAMAAHRIPPEKALLCVVAFYLFGVTQAISDLAHFFPPSWVYYIFLLVPPTNWWEGSDTDFIAEGPHIGRLGGIAPACVSVAFCLLAVYGIRGVFDIKKIWRLPVFLAAFAGSLFGGYRSTFVLFTLTFGLLFWFEGLPKSRYLPGMVCGMLMLLVVVLPFTDRLPLTVQRSLAVVPYIKLNQFARDAAEDTTEWRERVWLRVLPDVPKYLLVGRGLGISASDVAGATSAIAGTQADTAIMASDFHSGPLSIIIPFGLPGMLGFIWFIWAGTRALYFNYRYGDTGLRHINTFLLAAFVARTIFFLAVFGSFFGDLMTFSGMLGFGVALNGGIRKPVRVPKAEAVPQLT